MTARFHLGAPARACGFAAGWALFTLVLLIATRPMGLGPGFSRPLPYAIAAILFSVLGHLSIRWLNGGSAHTVPETGPKAAAQATAKNGPLRRFFKELFREPLRGLAAFFRGTAAFNNFVFLSIAYILGIGLTSIFIRKDASGNKPSDPAKAPATYWKDLNLGKQDADAYYRPF